MTLLDLVVLLVVVLICTFVKTFAWPLVLICLVALVIERIAIGQRLGL